jgi:hypothetical protein
MPPRNHRPVGAPAEDGFESRWGHHFDFVSVFHSGFRNIAMFLEPETRAHPHSLNIRSAFSS